MSYFKRLIDWLKEGKLLFVFLLIFGLVFHTPFLDEINIGLSLPDNVRIIGLILQIYGTGSIVSSLINKMNLFEGHGLLIFFINWLKRFPLKRKKKTINFTVEPTDITVESSGGRISIGPKEDLKQVIKYFQEEINYLHKELKSTHNETNKTLGKLSTKIRSIESSLDKQFKETHQLIKKSSLSNVWGELFGLACLILGLILSTVPDYVAPIISHVYNSVY